MPGCPAVFFWWELGCLRYLHRNFDLSKVQLVGASAGGLIATLAACGVDEDKAVRRGRCWQCTAWLPDLRGHAIPTMCSLALIWRPGGRDQRC